MKPLLCALIGFGFLATASAAIVALIALAKYLDERFAWFAKVTKITAVVLVVAALSWGYGFLICDTFLKGK